MVVYVMFNDEGDMMALFENEDLAQHCVDGWNGEFGSDYYYEKCAVNTKDDLGATWMYRG